MLTPTLTPMHGFCEKSLHGQWVAGLFGRPGKQRRPRRRRHQRDLSTSQDLRGPPPPRHANKAMTSAMSFAPVQPIHLPLNGSRTPRKSPPQWPRCLWWPKADYFPEQIRVPIGKSTSPNAARLRCRKPPQLAHQTITQAEVGVEPTIIFRQVSSAYPLKSRTCGTKRWSSRPWWAPGRTQVNRGGPCRSVGEDSTIQGRGNSLRLIIRIAFNSSRLNSDECERRAFSMLLLA